MRREFSVLAEGRHIFAGHYKDLTETGNRARKVSGTQGKFGANRAKNNDEQFRVNEMFGQILHQLENLHFQKISVYV